MNDIIQEYLAKLLALVSSTQIRFNQSLRHTLPAKGGIHRISKLGADWSRSIYVGETGNLRTRICNDLLGGNARSHTLVNALLETGQFADVAAVRRYLRGKCMVQVFRRQNRKERCLFEHFAIAILKPKYNDYQE